jgi:hypothetical protein
MVLSDIHQKIEREDEFESRVLKLVRCVHLTSSTSQMWGCIDKVHPYFVLMTSILTLGLFSPLFLASVPFSGTCVIMWHLLHKGILLDGGWYHYQYRATNTTEASIRIDTQPPTRTLE